MNVHVHTAAGAATDTFDHDTDMEERINNLSRLTRVIRLVIERVLPGGEVPIEEANREVLVDMVDDVDIQARDLRAAFYAKPK